MVAKKGRRSGKSVKNLQSKGLTAKQAKSVKGGFLRSKVGLADDESPKEILFTPSNTSFGIKR
jgi:hypothetical protein